MIRLRKESPEIGYGSWKIIDTDSPNTLAILYRWQNKPLVVVHNFSRGPQEVTLNADRIESQELTNLISSEKFNAADGRYKIWLDGYGYLWARPVSQ